MADFLLTCLMCVVVGIALRGCKHPLEATHLLRDLILEVASPATVLVALLGAQIAWSWLPLPALILV